MEILEYKNAIDIPDSLIPSLARSEVECWWAEPFSEYKICDDCKWLYSIEEVHGSVENFRNNSTCWDDYECVECWWETNYMYKTEEFIDMIREYIKWDVSAVLLVTPEEEVEGFWVLTKTNYLDVIMWEFNTRPWSYEKKLLKNLLIKEFEGNDSDEILCLHQIYIYEFLRWRKNLFGILNSMFKSIDLSTMSPILLETRYDSKLYSIMQSLWAKDLINDKYWYVIQVIKDSKFFINYIRDSLFFNNSSKNSLNCNSYLVGVSNINGGWQKRKFYC